MYVLHPGFSLFASLGYIDGDDSIVSFTLWKAVASTEANKFIRSTAIQEVKASLRRWYQRGRRVLLWSQMFPSAIFFKEVTAMKNSWSLDNFLVAKSLINRMIMTSWGRRTFIPVNRVESEYSTAFWPCEMPLFSRGEEVDMASNVSKSKYNISLSKSDSLYSFCNTLSY